MTMNLATFWALRTLESFLGPLTYGKYIFILAYLSSFIDCFVRKHFLHQEDTRSVGFSGVVFGLSAIQSLYLDSWTILGMKIPWSLTPFIELILIQILVPTASFVGHLSGIIIGFLIGMHLIGSPILCF